MVDAGVASEVRYAFLRWAGWFRSALGGGDLKSDVNLE